MSYKIRYAVKINREFARFEYKKYWLAAAKTLLVIFFAVVLLDVQHFFDLILPNNIEKTSYAFNSMISNVENGQPIKEAFAEFCNVIINEE